MDVVRHYAPSKLAVTPAFKELQCACHHIRNIRRAQVASPNSAIQEGLDSFGKELVQAFQLKRTELAALTLGSQHDVLAFELI